MEESAQLAQQLRHLEILIETETEKEIKSNYLYLK